MDCRFSSLGLHLGSRLGSVLFVSVSHPVDVLGSASLSSRLNSEAVHDHIYSQLFGSSCHMMIPTNHKLSTYVLSTHLLIFTHVRRFDIYTSIGHYSTRATSLNRHIMAYNTLIVDIMHVRFYLSTETSAGGHIDLHP